LLVISEFSRYVTKTMQLAEWRTAVISRS